MLELVASTPQLFNVALPQRIKAVGDFLRRPIPPTNLQQSFNSRIIKSFADQFGRHAADNRIGRHILGHHGASADDGPVANVNPSQDDRLETDPHVVADRDVALVRPRLLDGRRVTPCRGKDRERVRRESVEPMVCPVHDELRAAGDRAKLADYQPIVIAGRIVIQHVPPLELRRVFKIVVERVIADHDVRAGNDALQIAYRCVARPGKPNVGIK